MQCPQLITLLLARLFSSCFQNPHRLHLGSVLYPECFRLDLAALFFLPPANKKQMRGSVSTLRNNKRSQAFCNALLKNRLFGYSNFPDGDKGFKGNKTSFTITGERTNQQV